MGSTSGVGSQVREMLLLSAASATGNIPIGGLALSPNGTGFPSGDPTKSPIMGGPVPIIQNDPGNSARLLAGTDFGMYLSNDTGAGFGDIVDAAPYGNATTGSLSITGATAAMNGYVYQVIVSGSVAPAATSPPATLSVSGKSLELNSDHQTDVLDLAFFFQAFAPGVITANTPADSNGDGFVDDADLLLVLAGI